MNSATTGAVSNSPKIALSVAEAATLLSVSKPTLYELIRREDFPSFKLGNRTLISRIGLEEWVEKQVTR